MIGVRSNSLLDSLIIILVIFICEMGVMIPQRSGGLLNLCSCTSNSQHNCTTQQAKLPVLIEKDTVVAIAVNAERMGMLDQFVHSSGVVRNFCTKQQAHMPSLPLRTVPRSRFNFFGLNHQGSYLGNSILL